MSVRQSSRPFFDALSRTPSSTHICRKCRQSLKLQQNTFQARHASTIGPNTHRSRRLQEWKKPVSYPLYREEAPGQNITKIEKPSKEKFDDEGNSVFASTWDGLTVIPPYKHAKDLPRRAEDIYEPWQKATSGNLSQSDLISYLSRAIFNDGTEVKFETATTSQPEEIHVKKETSYDSPEKERAFLNEQVDLQSPKTFHILKHFSFLVGHRIPDPILTTLSQPSTNTYQHLVELLHEHIKPKPKNVAETLALNTELLSQGNVLVFPRQEKMKDREEEVGRWKIIEEELARRDLLEPPKPEDEV